jgi:uncharacterized protein (TIGR03086 family)
MTDGGTIETRFTAAVDEFGGRVRAIRDNQWSAPTPCTEWDVKALVNHLVGELRWMPPLLAGQTIAEVGDRLDGDLLGADPVGAWTSAVQDAVAAVGQPGALETVVHLSYGDTPATDYVAEVAADLTVHAWDLARGIGATEQLDPALVQWIYPQAKERLSPAGVPGYFGPAVPVSDNASDQARLLALYGRQA